jgi:hypothetical protein
MTPSQGAEGIEITEQAMTRRNRAVGDAFSSPRERIHRLNPPAESFTDALFSMNSSP